jgi:hypothetical protein
MMSAFIPEKDISLISANYRGNEPQLKITAFTSGEHKDRQSLTLDRLDLKVKNDFRLYQYSLDGKSISETFRAKYLNNFAIHGENTVFGIYSNPSGNDLYFLNTTETNQPISLKMFFGHRLGALDRGVGVGVEQAKLSVFTGSYAKPTKFVDIFGEVNIRDNLYVSGNISVSGAFDVDSLSIKNLEFVGGSGTNMCLQDAKIFLGDKNKIATHALEIDGGNISVINGTGIFQKFNFVGLTYPSASLPNAPAGYIEINVGGLPKKVPYY